MITGFYLFDATSGTTYLQDKPKQGVRTGYYVSVVDRDYDDLRNSLHKVFGSDDVDEFLHKLWQLPEFNDDIASLKRGRFEFVLFTQHDLYVRKV